MIAFAWVMTILLSLIGFIATISLGVAIGNDDGESAAASFFVIICAWGLALWGWLAILL